SVLSAVLLVALAQPAAATTTTSAATVLYVATAANGGNDAHVCSQPSPCLTVQHAVDVSGPGGTIHVGAGTFVGRVDLTGSSVTIIGAGQGKTFLDGAGGQGVVLVSQETLGAANIYTLTDLTVQHSNGTGGRGHAGGFTLLRGFLDLVRVTVTANIGVGIFNESSSVSIVDSTISDNTDVGLKNFEGNSDVSGSTFTRNRLGISDESSGSTFTNLTIAGNTGGGFSASNSAHSTITASTIANNGFGVSELGFIEGGLVFGVTIGSTIVANNSEGNCGISVGQSDSGYFKDSGYNLETDAGKSCMFSAAKHDLVGVDPQLGPLQDNGGPTHTMLPAATSPVVNALPTSTGLCPKTDQRKVTRPQGSACDVGAVEREAPRGVIVAVSFQNCSSLHVAYNRFTNGTVVHWTVSSNGSGRVASGDFTAVGGGNAGSKTLHFVTQPLGTTLKPEPVQSHVHFRWANGGSYVATRDPGC
ncbi:MAG: hypothetical protein JWM72_4400, partial [Actinomycetia bacterium]|nr:hypothetical protein [Actinomycetes bacterium]